MSHGPLQQPSVEHGETRHLSVKLSLEDAGKATLDELTSILAEAREAITSLAAIDWPRGRLALTLDEAAASLGIPPSTLADQLRNGKIKGAKVGRHWLLTRRQLLEALEGKAK